MAQDDKRDEAIAFLSRPKDYDRAIRRTKEAIRDTRLALTSISVNYSDMPKGGGGPVSRTEEGVVAIVALEEKLERLKEERAQVVDEVVAKICQLDDESHKVVLIQLFVVGASWGETIEMLGVSRKKVSELRKEAIDEFRDLLEREENNL